MKIIALEEHRDIDAELLDLGETRLEHMDAAGIDAQVLSLTMPRARAMPGARAFGAADAPATWI